MDIADRLLRRGGVRVGANVRRQATRVGRAVLGPLVWDVIDPLVLIPRGGERPFGRLEGNRVRVFGDFGA